MPKKGRRPIVVNGIDYHYKVSGYVTVIENTETGKVTSIPKDNVKDVILPRDVEDIIKRNKL